MYDLSRLVESLGEEDGSTTRGTADGAAFPCGVFRHCSADGKRKESKARWIGERVVKQLGVLRTLIIAILLVGSSARASIIIDFEESSIPLGTVFGVSQGDATGDTMLTTPEGIVVSLELFHIGSAVDFFQVEVGGRYAAYFESTPIELNNISLRFEFGGLNFDVTEVTFEFAEFGGWTNFSVNDLTLFEQFSLYALPPMIAPGIHASVADNTVTLTADSGRRIDAFLVGGQELVIDSVVIVPEPSTLILFGFLTCAAVGQRRLRQTG